MASSATRAVQVASQLECGVLSRLLVRTAGSTGVTLLAAGGVAVATQGASGVVQACAGPGGSQLRLADEGGTCRPQEEAISWSQAGPQGSRGQTGLRGQTRPQGPSGISSVTVARGEFREVAPGTTATFVYGCPDGAWATSAGPTLSPASDLVVQSVSPSEPAGAQQVVVENRGATFGSINLQPAAAASGGR